MLNETNSDQSNESWIWGVLGNIRGSENASKYTNYILPLVLAKHLCDIFEDDRRPNIFDTVSTERLGPNDVEADIIGKSYESLIRKFAKSGNRSAGEFYAPSEVGAITSKVLQPETGMEIPPAVTPVDSS